MKYYGLSLSNCVKDILNDKIAMQDVIFIITNTCITSRASLMDAIGIYSYSHWRNHSLNKIMNVVETLFFSGKIIQPRVLRIDGPNFPDTNRIVNHSYWVDGSVIDVESFFHLIEWKNSGETCEM